MRKDQYDKLIKAAGENAYLSFAVNTDETPVISGIIPWERSTSAFNMRGPTLTVSAADLQDAAVMSALKKCRITGCHIFAELPEYGFLKEFSELRVLFILKAGNLRDLSFLRDKPDLFMLYLQDASLPDLRPLVDVCNENTDGPSRCFGFENCRIADTSALEDVRFPLSELLIWPAEGDSAERWKTGVRPGVFRFYD